ncbi:hypothetical protein, partial [Lactobacillus jensenii]
LLDHKKYASRKTNTKKIRTTILIIINYHPIKKAAPKEPPLKSIKIRADCRTVKTLVDPANSKFIWPVSQ